MSDSEKTSLLRGERFKALRSWLLFVVFGAIIYFGNVELQSHFGRQALEATGLESLKLEDALTRAHTENKLVLVDMSAIWCPTCRRLDQEIFSNDDVKAVLDQHFVFSRIEYESDAGAAFMKRYSVRGFPTVLVLNTDGSLRQKLPLTFEPEKYISLMRAAL